MHQSLFFFPPSDCGNDNDQCKFGSQFHRWQKSFYQPTSLRNLLEQSSIQLPYIPLLSFYPIVPQPGTNQEKQNSNTFKPQSSRSLCCSSFTYLTHLFSFGFLNTPSYQRPGSKRKKKRWQSPQIIKKKKIDSKQKVFHSFSTPIYLIMGKVLALCLFSTSQAYISAKCIFSFLYGLFSKEPQGQVAKINIRVAAQPKEGDWFPALNLPAPGMMKVIKRAKLQAKGAESRKGEGKSEREGKKERVKKRMQIISYDERCQ